MTNDNAIPRSIAIIYIISEALEIFSAATLSTYIWLEINPPEAPPTWLERSGWLIAIMLFFLGAIARLYGNRLESHAEAERRKTEHEITERRLKTLEAVGVEEDILDVLSLRLNKPALPVEDFIAWLEKRIGRERAQERLQIILRYTRALSDTTQQQERREEVTSDQY